MSDPKKHHHVPQFLLDRWARQDGKLAVYSRKNGRLVVDWHAPEYTAFERELYSITALPKEDKQWVEREVMSKAVDGPAAKILQRLLTGELPRFDEMDRSTWTRFILAQWIRSPERIAELRKVGREALLKALESDPDEYLAIKGDSPYQTLPDWVAANAPGLDEIVAMGSVLPKMISDSDPGNIVINMRWEVLHLNGTKHDLMISDRPVVRMDGLKNRNCMIMIPLDPNRLFVASHHDRNFKRFEADDIVKAANETTVFSAKDRVYGTGEQHNAFVEKRFRRQ